MNAYALRLAMLAGVLLALERRSDACVREAPPPPYYAPELVPDCPEDVALGYVQVHTREYYEAKLAAAELSLRVSPGRLAALDAKAAALLWLGRLPEAKHVLDVRAAAVRDVIVLANLGTYYSLTGDRPRAIEAIDAVLAVDPDAHRGGETYHRLLLVSPTEMTGPGDDPSAAVRGLTAMLATGGAHRSPHVYFALGDALARTAFARAAWAAWEHAKELGHPSPDLIEERQRKLQATSKSDFARWYRAKRPAVEPLIARYQATERELIKSGTRVWTADGVDELFETWRRVGGQHCRSAGNVDAR